MAKVGQICQPGARRRPWTWLNVCERVGWCCYTRQDEEERKFTFVLFLPKADASVKNLFSNGIEKKLSLTKCCFSLFWEFSWRSAHLVQSRKSYSSISSNLNSISWTEEGLLCHTHDRVRWWVFSTTWQKQVSVCSSWPILLEHMFFLKKIENLHIRSNITRS